MCLPNEYLEVVGGRGFPTTPIIPNREGRCVLFIAKPNANGFPTTPIIPNREVLIGLTLLST